MDKHHFKEKVRHNAIFKVEMHASLGEMRKAYRHNFGIPSKEKISKKMIAEWMSSMVYADIEDYIR